MKVAVETCNRERFPQDLQRALARVIAAVNLSDDEFMNEFST
jgi:hypothetical protein